MINKISYLVKVSKGNRNATQQHSTCRRRYTPRVAWVEALARVWAKPLGVATRVKNRALAYKVGLRAAKCPCIAACPSVALNPCTPFVADITLADLNRLQATDRGPAVLQAGRAGG